MNKKLLLLSLLLIAVLLVTGCAGSVVNEEKNIRGVITSFFSAFNSYNFDKARSYCINGSQAYDVIFVVEEEVNEITEECATFSLRHTPNIDSISIVENSATVLGTCLVVFSCDDEGFSESFMMRIKLQKIDDNWKLYELIELE